MKEIFSATLRKLDLVSTKLCKPDPKIYPTENEATLAFMQNRFVLTVHLSIVFADLISFPFCDFSMMTNLLRISLGLLLLTIFLLFCRSHPLACKIINTILLNIVGIMMSNGPEGPYFALIVSYGVPCVAFYVTQSLSFTAISSMIQLSTIMTSFKANLIQEIIFSQPQTFADNLTKSFLTVTIPLQMVYLLVVYLLKEKTAELCKAKKIAEEALDQQKIFVYSFSHEMRNPMNSLLGNLDLALMSQLVTPEIREMITTAKTCGILLLNLINTVLDAGKLNTLGKLEVNPVPVKIHDILQRTWSISHDIITRKGLKCHLKISKDVPPRLLLDSHRLNQVIMNLIGNAIKFTEKGLIAFSVKWLMDCEKVTEECFLPAPHNEEDEGVFEKDYNIYAIKRNSQKKKNSLTREEESLILSGPVKEFNLDGVSQPGVETNGVLKFIIRDSGCGICEEDVKKLFQQFSQVGKTACKRQMGTGLGLYISKEICESMGGEVRAYSKMNVGSTFVICIPTKALPLMPESPLHFNLNNDIIPRLREQKLKTIVADDSSFNVSLVSNFYSKMGIKVVATASNGQAGFERYLERAAQIDIITLDIDMPIMDGKEVCEKIRKHEKDNGLKRAMIILISGNYEEEEIMRDGNNADCFLRKPLVFEEFCWAIYKYRCGSFARRSITSIVE